MENIQLKQTAITLFNYLMSLISRSPKVGDLIHLIWLDAATNAPGVRNAYIGAKGKVIQVYKNGSFDLRYTSGALLVVGKRYRYKKLIASFS